MCVYTMEHYSAFTNNEILFYLLLFGVWDFVFAEGMETWVKLKIICKEISAPETLVLYVLFYIWKQKK